MRLDLLLVTAGACALTSSAVVPAAESFAPISLSTPSCAPMSTSMSTLTWTRTSLRRRHDHQRRQQCPRPGWRRRGFRCGRGSGSTGAGAAWAALPSALATAPFFPTATPRARSRTGTYGGGGGGVGGGGGGGGDSTTLNLFGRAPWAAAESTEETAEATTKTGAGAGTIVDNGQRQRRQQRPRPDTPLSSSSNGHGIGAGMNTMEHVSRFLWRDDGADEAWELLDMEDGAAAMEKRFGSGGATMSPPPPLSSSSSATTVGIALGVVAIAAALAASGLSAVGGGDLSLQTISEASAAIQGFFANPASALEPVVNTVQSMGPSGLLYFGIVYTVAEILAIPALPLTASAGYLFGLTEGTAVVLVSASIAASISFVIGRTLLRTYVESVLEEYPKFNKIDKAIGREGFKLMLLLRLSPVFPFALSNYLYGATSIGFWPYFFGTMLGFTPGTIAYVYTGEIGKALTVDSSTAEPWYVYAGGLVLLSGFLKVVADVATSIIEDLDKDDDE